MSSDARPGRRSIEAAQRLSVAPMIDVTDRHFRYLIRCISPLPVVYTEMTWDRAILYNTPGEREHQNGQKNVRPRSLESIIGFSEVEHPIVLQLGGAETEPIYRAARVGAARGYDEINLNCGCPAQVKGRSKNCYGARLMAEPDRVAACCLSMNRAVADAAAAGELPAFRNGIPPKVTVKCRLGVDNVDSYEELVHFVTSVSASGVTHFIVHARKAILGLNTVQNRSVPPLRRDWVYKLISDFPSLTFTINGAVGSLEEAHELLERGAHGVMIGRKANSDPYNLFSRCGVLYNGEAGPSRREVLDAYLLYCGKAEGANWEETTIEGCARSLITPLTGLFHCTAFGPKWRHALTSLMQDRDALLSGRGVPALVREALAEVAVTDALLDDRPSIQLHRPLLPKRQRGYNVDGENYAGNGGIEAGAAASTDGEACCSGAQQLPKQQAWRRSGKGEDEMEAVLESEAAAADGAKLRLLMGGATVMLLCAAAWSAARPR